MPVRHVVGVVFVRKTREAPNRVSNPVQPWVRLRRSACRGSRSAAGMDSTCFDACLAQARAPSPLGSDPQACDLSRPGVLQALMSDLVSGQLGTSADLSADKVVIPVSYPFLPFHLTLRNFFYFCLSPSSTSYSVLFFHFAAVPLPPFSASTDLSIFSCSFGSNFPPPASVPSVFPSFVDE